MTPCFKQEKSWFSGRDADWLALTPPSQDSSGEMSSGYPDRPSGHKRLMPITDSSAAVRIRVSDNSLVENLRNYLEASECAVRVVGQVTLDVAMPRASTDDQALREIAIFLRTWQAMNPEVVARVVGQGETR